MENSSLRGSGRLPRNFHKTFVPERRYIRDMLRFSAGGKSGDYQMIAQETGIPMGKFTGKVPATLDYCRGMGLLVNMKAKSAVKSPELTPFGRIVFLEDSRLSERITQWIAHFNMCDPGYGADAWYHVFTSGRYILGMQFTRSQLNDYLISIYGVSSKNLIGPMIRMYQDEASFENAEVLSEENDVIKRLPAPVAKEYSNAYTAWILSLTENYFPTNKQVSIAELEKVCGWQSIAGWSDSQAYEVLSMIEMKGGIIVDRQMQPRILHRVDSSNTWWNRLYEDLI